ncbi:hypothetical protein NL87_18320 [Salmonella enterica]|nr:hypothetical protein [Salmonella enterica subsp. enterica]EAW9008145.1 hypothetical protein [Salmonella enterica]EAY5638903.1 hypothetical protein [Salmonella enterica]EBP3786584.1 hypothetical protein [Salmonella enterica subsp. enterica]EBP3796188.1 hypothetical protein [Salmonella enterica subsp. enterica]
MKTIQQAKILFAFPVLWKENMTKDYLAHPNEFIRVNQGERRSVMVTFGLYAPLNVNMVVTADINRVGQRKKLENLQPDPSSVYSECLRINILHDLSGVLLSSIEVKNVSFEESGLYEINISVVPEDKEKSKKELIDSIRNFFFVLVKKE